MLKTFQTSPPIFGITQWKVSIFTGEESHQCRRVTGEPQGHRAHAEMGYDLGQHASKAVSSHITLALEHCGGTVGSLWHPARSFLPGSR